MQPSSPFKKKKKKKKIKLTLLQLKNLDDLKLSKTIQIKPTTHAGHCWRSKDKLISDVFLWIFTHGCTV